MPDARLLDEPGCRQMDRLFRQSGLFRPKWDVPHFGGGKTYGQATIEKAIYSDGEVYSTGSRASIPTCVRESSN